MKSWLNDISRDINNGIRRARSRYPSTATVQQWYQDFISSGQDRTQRFYDYKKTRLKQWRSQKRTKR